MTVGMSIIISNENDRTLCVISARKRKLMINLDTINPVNLESMLNHIQTYPGGISK